jgi:hypothetical protein
LVAVGRGGGLPTSTNTAISRQHFLFRNIGIKRKKKKNEKKEKKAPPQEGA